MRIMAMGSRPVTGRLISALAGSDFELACPAELFEAVVLLKRHQFDLVVVDSSAEGAEATCHYLNKVRNTPLVLMIMRKRQDWRKTQSLEVDGYIPQEVNGAELVARLKAVSRRFHSASELKNAPLARAPEKF